MRSVIVSCVELLCGLVWLLLLVATDFNILVISGGLLGMLYIIGSPAAVSRQQHRSRPHSHR